MELEWKGTTPTHGVAAECAGGGGRRRAAMRLKTEFPFRGVADFPTWAGAVHQQNAGKRPRHSLNMRGIPQKGISRVARTFGWAYGGFCGWRGLGVLAGVAAKGLGGHWLRRLMESRFPADVIYIQGSRGHGWPTAPYGRLDSGPVGPVARRWAAWARFGPAGSGPIAVCWGYSYLDGWAAYGYALGLLGAIYHARGAPAEGPQWDRRLPNASSGIFQPGGLDP